MDLPTLLTKVDLLLGVEASASPATVPPTEPLPPSAVTPPPPENNSRELVTRAWAFARKAHEGQKRLSGDPYEIHLMEVAGILADLQIDVVSVAAGLLHDTLEDTSVTPDQLKTEFGEDVANLVDGVTKISRRQFQDGEIRHAESLRKMLVAMARDVRVVLIKLADRLHNMRTLEFLPEEKRLKIARETLELYAPLAHRLGMSKIRIELEDLSLRYLESKTYWEIAEKVALKRAEREAMVGRVKDLIEGKLAAAGIPAQVSGRSKHFYSIWRKMIAQQKDVDEIFDLLALRVLTGTVKQCYEILGLVHELWKPLPGRFKDYVAMPKNNMYQSLHTTVMGPDAQPVEIQIRTYDMHKVAEEGIAAHWTYKEKRAAGKDDAKFAWIRQLLDLQQDIQGIPEGAGSFKVDVFEDEVFVFTPTGDVKELPKGATALDFAYAVHTDLGNHTFGVKINGHMAPLKAVLKSGDIVEVLTQTHRAPSRDWIKQVTTSRAKNKIRHWFRTHLSDEEIERGRQMLDKEARRMGLDFHASGKGASSLTDLAAQFNCHTAEELLANVGHGEVSPRQLLNRLLPKTPPIPGEKYQEKPQDGRVPRTGREPKEGPEGVAASEGAASRAALTGISIAGHDDLMVKFARCCTPVPGDPIVGYITRGRGVSVHRADCPNTADLSNQEDRMVKVTWNVPAGQVFEAAIRVKARNRDKLLSDMLHALSGEGLVINEASARAMAGGLAEGYFVVQIKNSEQLQKILAKLNQVPDVLDAQRTEPK